MRARGALLGATLLALTAVPRVPQMVASTTGAVSGRVGVVPLAVFLDISPSRVVTGERFVGSAEVANLGSSPVRRVEVTLHFDPAGLRVRSRQTIALGTISPTGSASASWRLCSILPGSYLLMASAAGVGSDNQIHRADSAAHVVTVSQGPRATCP